MKEQNQKRKILMIEDDIFLRKIYRDQLTSQGFEFSEATNGIEGLHKIMSDKPDLILLDLMLPMKNGFDVLSEIKSNPVIKDIPVIILTNLGQESDIKEGLALGAIDYIIKSESRLSEVIQRIKNCLTKAKK